MTTSWLERRAALIDGSPLLRAYGAALGAVHVLTAIYWWTTVSLARIVTDPIPICWPFLPDCGSLRLASASSVNVALAGYLVVALASTGLFARARWSKLAWIALVAANLLKAALFLQDYRLMGNYHYMPFVVSFAYLVWPDPRRVIPYLLVGFYVSAGALKLDPEWLSGAAMIQRTWLPGRLLEVGCAMVVVMELVVVFGLLAARGRLRVATLVVIAGFHAYSWHVVGYFYPCVMGLLLLYFPLRWREPPEGDGSPFFALFEGRAGAPTYAALALYALAQLAPAFFPGDVALTGEGRMFALNMFDARTQCDHFSFVRRGKVVRELSDPHPGTGVRIRCDPILYWNKARHACSHLRELGGEGRIDAYLTSRRTTERIQHPIFAIRDFCGSAPRFDLFRHNPWMQLQ